MVTPPEIKSREMAPGRASDAQLSKYRRLIWGNVVVIIVKNQITDSYTIV